MQHRPEIDGLRAFAILPVLVFHAVPEWLPGGYVGVDVFFVISGFLITSILIKDLEADSFSIWKFYERRARRILPALLLMLLVTTVLAWKTLGNHEIGAYLRSLAGASLFYSNFVFWSESSYFDIAAEAKPLLHTWSLAIEEQYYLVTPFLLYFGWRGGLKTLTWIFVALTVFSFALSVGLSGRDPVGSFYLLHTRFWELGIGALSAIYLAAGRRHLPPIMALVGAALIAASFILFSKQTTFPGAAALLPTLGTALIMLAAWQGTLPGAALSFAPFRWIGLLSYSAYLWHQPLLVFARKLSFDPLTNVQLVAISLSSLIFAFVSWRFVEQPFRRPGFLTRRIVLQSSAVILVVIAVMAVNVAAWKVTKNRTALSGIKFNLAEEFTDRAEARAKCDTAKLLKTPLCDRSDSPRAVLWGDSYAIQWVWAIEESPSAFGIDVITKPACSPIFDIANQNAQRGIKWGESCLKHNDRALKLIADSPAEIVIMASPYPLLSSSSKALLANGDVVAEVGDMGKEYMIATLEKLKELGKKPVIITGMPNGPRNAADCLTKAILVGRDLSVCDFPIEEDKRTVANDPLSEVAETAGAALIRIQDSLCAGGTCVTSLDNYPIYRDGGHINAQGSRLVGKHFDLAGQVLKAAGVAQ